MEAPATKLETIQTVTHTSPVKLQFAPPSPPKQQISATDLPVYNLSNTTKTTTNVVFKSQGGVEKVNMSSSVPVATYQHHQF